MTGNHGDPSRNADWEARFREEVHGRSGDHSHRYRPEPVQDWSVHHFLARFPDLRIRGRGGVLGLSLGNPRGHKPGCPAVGGLLGGNQRNHRGPDHPHHRLVGQLLPVQPGRRALFLARGHRHLRRHPGRVRRRVPVHHGAELRLVPELLGEVVPVPGRAGTGAPAGPSGTWPTSRRRPC